MNNNEKGIRNASALSKIKIKINEYPSQDEPNKNKIKTQINQIFETMNKYNEKYKLILLKATDNKIVKENIILSLKKDLAYHKEINKNFMEYKTYSDKIHSYYKDNYENILKYKTNLAEDLHDFVQIINKYEEKIDQYKKEKVQLIRTSEDIIKMKLNEREKLNERLQKINLDLENQNNKLNGLKTVMNEYETQNKTYLNNLNNSELEHKEKYEILEQSYQNLLKRYNYYKDLEGQKLKVRFDELNENLCIEEKRDADLKFQDNFMKNIFLKNIVDDIKKQMKDIEVLNRQYQEEQKMLKFLGKSLFNKLKQRKGINIETEIESSNDFSPKTNKTKIDFQSTSYF